VIKAEYNLPGTERKGERLGEGAEGRNDPNNVCTYEKNKKIKSKKKNYTRKWDVFYKS
jgi:hypothetical protein